MTWQPVTGITLEEFHRTGIGGSSIAVLMEDVDPETGVRTSLHPYKTEPELWLEMTGRKAPEDISEIEKIRWGNLLEPVILQEAASRLNARMIMRDAMVRSAIRDYEIGTIDAVFEIESATEVEMWCATDKQHKNGKDLIWEPRLVSLDAGTRVVVDAKNSASEWVFGDRFPVYYECQGVWYSGLLGLNHSVFAVLFGGCELRFYLVPHSAELYFAMRTEARRFWKSLKAKQPDRLEQGPLSEIRQIRQVEEGSRVIATGDLEALIADYQDAKRRAANAEAVEKACRMAMEAQLPSAAVIECPRLGVEYKRTTQTRRNWAVPEHVKVQYPGKPTVVQKGELVTMKKEMSHV